MIDLERKLAAIFYADVAGYSRLTGEDEEGTHLVLRDHLDLMAASIRSHQGRIVHYAGDAVLADFNTVVDALKCATRIQSELRAANEDRTEDRKVRFRIGINLGDVIVDKGEIYGDGVNIAARLEGLADAGGICVSESVRTAAGSKLALHYEFMGEQRVKNIADPIRAYRVLSEGEKSEPGRAVTMDAPILPDKPSIVVLAFDNMSNDPEQEYFSDGISEDIITELSKVPGLFVIARNSAFAYKGKSVNVQEVSRELGVSHVLEGSVRKSGNRLRITAQLIDGTSGGHLWAERFDREMQDIFQVQDEVTEQIVDALALKLAPRTEDSENRMTRDLEAYDYFLRGRQQALMDTPHANAQAQELLEKAIALDPEFSMAYAHLARNYAIAYVDRWTDDPERTLAVAIDFAHKAVLLDDANPFAHFAVFTTVFWQREHELAEEEVRKAIALDPNFSDGYAGLGTVLVYVGKPAEAMQALRTSMRLDPHYRDIYLHMLALAYFHSGEYRQAEITLRRRLIRKPDSDISRVLLASVYGHIGEVEKARTEWSEVMRINPDYSIEHRRRILPYKNPDDFEHIVAGLNKAGLP